MAESNKPPRARKLVEKSVMKVPLPARSRESFLRELKRAARGRLDKRSPEK
ncbi:MAG: hypothetical protein M3198_17425 [Actinomycetota bacterium]|nr:hypothetical protein [Actinomycetota bacterium]